MALDKIEDSYKKSTLFKNGTPKMRINILTTLKRAHKIIKTKLKSLQ